MRIYLPATIADLRSAEGLSARRAHALTGALREVLGDTDEEAGEFQAMLTAAEASVDLLTERPAEPPIRVVVAADVDGLEPDRSGGPSAVHAPAVPWALVVSFHVDDPDDEAAHDLVRRAAGGDTEARTGVGELDLLWFDATERSLLTGLW